ncbi:MAG: aspartate kinase [Bacillota bacterium]|nr:aspartate kinase [Bacillota bacterium]
MGVKVAKFGGSSVADAIQMKKVRDIIMADPERRYIVVSAPGKRFAEDSKLTDLLYLCKTHIEHNVPFHQVFQVVWDRFKIMVMNLGLDLDLDPYFMEIKDNLQNGASNDYIASRGEFLSAVITADFLGFDFVDPKDYVKFDHNGKFMPEETNEALKEELAKHEYAVMPGFYGAKPDGSIKTFSRGGSDITGALVARAVNAEIYENWTDVSGFLMADPRIVDNAKPISRVTYKELRELSYMGASVLHDEAIFPVKEAKIPINIRNTNQPEHHGTIIVDGENFEETDEVITGISGRKGFTVIAIYKDNMNSEVGYVKRLLSVLENYNISFEHLPSGIDTVSVVISTQRLEGILGDVLEDIQKKMSPDTLEVHSNLALIATVGHGMIKRPGVSATLFTALYQAGVNIRMIDQGSSEMNIIVGVEEGDFETAIKAIYDAFVEKKVLKKA